MRVSRWPVALELLRRSRGAVAWRGGALGGHGWENHLGEKMGFMFNYTYVYIYIYNNYYIFINYI
jgi:hypothetical protein